MLVVVGGGVGGDIDVVGGSSSAHANVEGFSGGLGADDEVGLVGGDSLGAMNGGGLAELDVVADVAGGQPDRHRRRP